MAEVEWNTNQLRAFARSLNHDKDGRALRKQMEARFDAITEGLRDQMQQSIPTIQRLGSYPQVVAEAIHFKTKLIGGPKARVAIVGEAKSPHAKKQWRELGTLFENGYLYHPAWGRWHNLPLPEYLRQEVPQARQVFEAGVDAWTPNVSEEIRTVLNHYLDELTKIRGAS